LRLPKNTSLSFLMIANSGRPYTLTTGRDENGDQTTNDRPPGIGRNSLVGPGSYNVNANFTKLVPLRKENPQKSASTVPVPGAPQIFVGGPGGAIGIPQGPGSTTPGPKLQFTVSANNLLNNAQFRGYSGVLTSPLFGRPTGAAAGRAVMLGLGLLF
jgi:hypothetical protein